MISPAITSLAIYYMALHFIIISNKSGDRFDQSPRSELSIASMPADNPSSSKRDEDPYEYIK